MYFISPAIAAEVRPIIATHNARTTTAFLMLTSSREFEGQKGDGSLHAHTRRSYALSLTWNTIRFVGSGKPWLLRWGRAAPNAVGRAPLRPRKPQQENCPNSL